MVYGIQRGGAYIAQWSCTKYCNRVGVAGEGGNTRMLDFHNEQALVSL